MIQSSAKKRQKHKTIGIDSAALAQITRFGHVLLRAIPIPPIEANGGEAVIARDNKLRLADLFGYRQRLAVFVVRLLKLAPTLMDLCHDDQRHGKVVELPQLAVERRRGLRRL